MAAIPLTGTELQLAASMASSRVSGSSNNVSGQPIPPILTLPSEMIEMIGEAADPYDLLAARLSCTGICAWVTKPFVKAYFTIRRHIVTMHSLSALIDITAHPVFGPAIREIWISTTSQSSTLLEYLEMEYGEIERYHYIDLVTVYGRARDEESRLGESGGSELLAQALINLRNLNVVVSLGVFKQRASETKAWGYQHVYGMFPEEILFAQESYNYHELLFSAVQLSQYPLRVLLIDSQGGSDLQELGVVDDVCSQITELHVLDQEALVDGLKNSLTAWLLGSLSKLTKLHVEISLFSRDITKFSALHGIHLQHLRDFSLSNLKVRSSSLVKFLKDHGSTLRTLKLANLELEDPKNWDHVFRSIRGRLSLQKLEVCKLRANCAFGNGENEEDDYAEPPFQEEKYDNCPLAHYTHLEYNETEDASVCVLRHLRCFVGAEQMREGLKDLIGHFVPTESIDPKYEATWHSHDP